MPVGAGGRGASRDGDPPPPREVRKPGGRGGGVGKGARRAGRPDRPGPARGEDARPRDAPSGPRGSRRAAATAREARGGGPGWCGGRRRAAGHPPFSLLHPARPGPPRRGRPTRALGVHPSTHPRAGRGRPGGEDTATGPRGGGARPGTRPALGRAHRGGGAPSSSTRRRRRRRRRRHGRRIGAAAGPGSEAHRGTRPRGAADGEGTEADGRTERGTDGVRPRGADTTQPVAEVGWPRATARGTAQSDPAEGTRVGRRGPPRDLTARGPPGTGAVPRHHPGRRRTGAPTLAGLAPTATATPRAAAGPGRTLSRRTPAAPAPTALTRAGLPAPPPSLRASEGTAPPGDATGPAEAGGRHPREARRGRLGPRQGTGTRAVARAGRGRGRGRRRRGGAGKHARRGPRDRDAGAAPRTRRQRPGTRPGPQEHQRGIPPPPAREGGPATPGAPAGPGHPRSVAHDPAPPPRPASRPPVFRHPSATDPSFHLRLNPEARHPGDDALERGGPDRDRTPPPAAAQAARAGATGPSSPPAGGAGEAEADRASRPDTAPLPPGLTPRGPAARTRPPTCRTPGGAQRDPPPTRRGEARAAVGNERHTAPPRGRRTQLPPLPRRAGEFCSAHVLWQSPRWPLRTREGQRLGAPVPQGSLSDR